MDDKRELRAVDEVVDSEIENLLQIAAMGAVSAKDTKYSEEKEWRHVVGRRRWTFYDSLCPR